MPKKKRGIFFGKRPAAVVWGLIERLPFFAFLLVLSASSLLVVTIVSSRSSGLVKGFSKISALEGNLLEALDDGDEFGIGLDAIGDLDDDGVTDFAVGAWEDDDGGANYGAVYVLFMKRDGTVKSSQKISMSSGDFVGPITGANNFGFSVAGIGDLDGDAVEDIAVSERANDDGGTNRGAVYVLFLNTDGTVKDEQRISDTEGGFTATLDDLELFGDCIEAIPDFNDDAIDDLVVCAPQDDDGGADRGAFYVLFMNADGTVNGYEKFSQTSGLPMTLDDGDRFAKGFAVLGDLDGNGADEWVVGTSLDDDGGTDRGAVYVLYMNTDGSILDYAKISGSTVGFTDALSNDDRFGSSVDVLPDIDGDGIDEILAGTWLDDDGGTNRGAFYILFLYADGSLKRYQKISDIEGEFAGELSDDDSITVSGLSSIGDFNRDGAPDVAVSAFQDDDGGTDRGAFWILYLRPLGSRGRNYVFPVRSSVVINDGAACTSSRDVVLTLSARQADYAVVGHDANFVGYTFTSFDEPTEERSWRLTAEPGLKRVYALFKSSTGELSTVQSADILYDPVTNCR